MRASAAARRRARGRARCCAGRCGAGVYAAIDLGWYIVEKHCDRERAIDTANTLPLETPRIW